MSDWRKFLVHLGRRIIVKQAQRNQLTGLRDHYFAEPTFHFAHMHVVLLYSDLIIVGC